MNLTWYDGGKLPPRPLDLPDGAKLSDNGIYFVGDKGTMVCGGWSGRRRSTRSRDARSSRSPPRPSPARSATGPNGSRPARPASREDAKAGFAYSGPFTEVLLVGNLAL